MEQAARILHVRIVHLLSSFFRQIPECSFLRGSDHKENADFAGVTGAGGENRTLDLPLTKGLRYHYATPASGGRMGRGGRYSQAALKGKGPMKPRSEAKQTRLAKALRENLKRRKARGRALENKAEIAPERRPDPATKTDLT
jgi:hypothetical protein